MISPRPYQSEAVDAVWDRLVTRDERSTLIVLPTGTGKTVCFGLLARRWSRDREGRILILAHREELITQARDEIAGITGQIPAIEMADNRAIAGSTALPDMALPRVVIGSVPTMCQANRLARWPRDEFSLIVTDEAHHATARSYRNIYGHFTGAKMLGVTATPQRADKAALGMVYDSVAYQMGICEAVEDGWLVPVEQRFVIVKDMDLSKVKTAGDDFVQSQIGCVLTGDKVLDKMVAATIDLCGEKPTLVFTAPRGAGDTVSQGEVFADALNKIKPGKAVFLSGETDPVIRRDELKRFESGDRQYLVGCALFVEGFNAPKIQRIVMAQPTKSVVRYTQAIGRGTRTLRGVLTPEMDTSPARRAAIEASAKPSVLVIDFVGNSGRHKLISACDIFAGQTRPEAVERAKKKAVTSAKPVSKLLDEAEAELTAEARKREQRQKEREKIRVNRVEMFSTEVNPYEYSSGGVTGRATGQVAGAPATKQQREWIESHGGIWVEGDTAGQAGHQIAEIKRRWKQGLCSPKQERVLKRCGLASGPIPKEHAKALLDYAAACNWRVRGRPMREQLTITRADSGFRLAIDGTPVGPSFVGVDEVRQAYQGLARSPVPAAV